MKAVGELSEGSLKLELATWFGGEGRYSTSFSPRRTTAGCISQVKVRPDRSRGMSLALRGKPLYKPKKWRYNAVHTEQSQT